MPPEPLQHPPRLRVILMGLRASGKSTVGPLLAQALGTGFVDLDERTRALLGAESVRSAFESAGEPAFRRAEAAALATALREPHSVVALGGGTPTATGAEDLLQAARRRREAYIVFLDPPDEVLAARLSASAGDRPSLTGRGVVEEVSMVARDRRERYAALADLRLREPLAPEALVSIITSQVASASSS